MTSEASRLARRTRRIIAVALTASVSSLSFFVGPGCGEEGSSPEPPDASRRDRERGLDLDLDALTPGSSEQTPIVVRPTIECAIGAAIEAEPNDTSDEANAFTGTSFCGVLSSADDADSSVGDAHSSVSDVDYSTFDTPPGKKLVAFQAVIEGKVDFELTFGGATFKPNETSKFGAGTYIVKAFTMVPEPARYTYRLQFE